MFRFALEVLEPVAQRAVQGELELGGLRRDRIALPGLGGSHEDAVVAFFERQR
jgi:hypothetical protein